MADEKKNVDITALFEQGDAVRDAIRRGAMEAAKMYIHAGEPMVSWEDGKVIHIPPEELKLMLAEAEKADAEK